VSPGLAAVLLASVFAVQGCSVAPAAEAEAEAEAEARSSAAAVAAAPTECPLGFTRAMDGSTNVLSSKEVAAHSLPLPEELTSKMVCVVRQETEFGPSVVAVMRADLTYQNLRHALWGAGFDDEGRDALYVRKGAIAFGDIESALTQRYGALASSLTESDRGFAPFRHTFPPETQVADFSIKSKPRKPRPARTPQFGDLDAGGYGSGSIRAWSCGWSPTMNYDWHDDVLCTNGSEQDRPYLLPNDSYVTEDEIRRAADEYERHLNGN
jgi:hypothetical protein